MTTPTLGHSRLTPLAACALVALAALAPHAVLAQSNVRISGTAFVDYAYQLTSPDEAEEGDHGFTYRRLYLTADAPISDAFSARARLEANDSSLGSRGPTPFVKDLYLKWKVGGGHALTIGVSSPPVFSVVEEVWGYRSLEKTLLDLNRVTSSRDFGVRANGPLAGDALQYGVMVGNNEGVFPEDDRYKRVYGQLAYLPNEAVTVAVAANYAGFEAEPGERESRLAVSGVAGYVTEAWRAGVEAFLQTDAFDGNDDLATTGVSVFGAVNFTPQWSVVGRVDLVSDESFTGGEPSPSSIEAIGTTFGLVALVYRPHEEVELMPNLLFTDVEGDDTAATLARVTLHFQF